MLHKHILKFTMLSDIKKAKVKWHCRRGMLELDLFFEKFLANHLNSMTDDECDKFELFLQNPDPDLYAWFMGYEKPTDKLSLHFVDIIQSNNKFT
ncbi:MAG: succinate dehydrogenase assembly factor 2 [Legionellaceae bacterium]|nr:succinate dehydrogenase assembly factor 2 [Legionellaceae bacterium]